MSYWNTTLITIHVTFISVHCVCVTFFHYDTVILLVYMFCYLNVICACNFAWAHSYVFFLDFIATQQLHSWSNSMVTVPQTKWTNHIICLKVPRNTGHFCKKYYLINIFLSKYSVKFELGKNNIVGNSVLENMYWWFALHLFAIFMFFGEYWYSWYLGHIALYMLTNKFIVISIIQ